MEYILHLFAPVTPQCRTESVVQMEVEIGSFGDVSSGQDGGEDEGLKIRVTVIPLPQQWEYLLVGEVL